MKYDTDCVIIGSGISGMTCAIYLKRANVDFILLDNSAPGGLLNKINKIENYPGFKNISGPDLAYNLYSQITSLGIKVKYGNVLNIENNVITTDIEQIKTKFIVIATGRKAKKLNIQDLPNISYCVTCDANLYKDKTVAIIGNDEKTLQDAIYLSDICQKVILISNKKIKKNNIEVYKKQDDIIIKNNLVESIIINNKKINIQGLFISLGYEPNEIKDDIKKEKGYIIVNKDMQTNIDYIYAIGDAIKKDYYQLTTATSEATIAALNIKKRLSDRLN